MRVDEFGVKAPDEILYDAGDVYFAAKATITNLSAEDVSVFIEIQGVDIEGYEAVSGTLKGVIASGETRTLTSRLPTSPKALASVDQWQVGNIEYWTHDPDE
ncbi:MAG TPA: hypothetical protein VMN78_14095 [Longimicrobiales bacterium]|nr:hypothetical protein [Longimicrobiales bacterium]